MVLNSGDCTVFGIERKWREAGENYIVRSFVISFLIRRYYGGQIERDEMD